MSRNFAFLTEHNVSLGMDTKRLDDDRSQITLSLAFCRDSGVRADQFNQQVARTILNERLDHAVNGSNRVPPSTIQFTYQGNRPQVEVFYPLLDAIRNNMERVVEIVKRDLSVVRGRVVDHAKHDITLATAEGHTSVNLADILKLKHVRTRRKVNQLNTLLKDAAAHTVTVA